jgi:tripartite-type tricarboxylate transporter receptor subunit TctC
MESPTGAPCDRTRGSRLLRAALLLISVTAAASSAYAEDDFPSHPLRLVAPIAAGGPSDTAARLVAAALMPRLGQSVVVENRTGAGGVVGTEAAATATPDGYTLLLSIAAVFTVIPSMKVKTAYDIEKDFAPIGQVWSASQALVVNTKSPFKSVADLVAYAKANPGKVVFGSAGVGTTTHLSIELLQRGAGISVVHVPYRGTSNSLEDVLNQNIDAVFGDVANLMPFIQSGQLVALATTGDQRSSLLPDIPTMIELGIPAVRTVNWYGLHTQAATPAPVQDRLKAAVRDVQLDPDFKARLAKDGAITGTVGADDFGKMILDERARLAPIVKSLGL